MSWCVIRFKYLRGSAKEAITFRFSASSAFFRRRAPGGARLSSPSLAVRGLTTAQEVAGYPWPVDDHAGAS